MLALPILLHSEKERRSEKMAESAHRLRQVCVGMHVQHIRPLLQLAAHACWPFSVADAVTV